MWYLRSLVSLKLENSPPRTNAQQKMNQTSTNILKLNADHGMRSSRPRAAPQQRRLPSVSRRVRVRPFAHCEHTMPRELRRRDTRGGRAGVIARHRHAPGRRWVRGTRAPGDHRRRRCRRRHLRRDVLGGGWAGSRDSSAPQDGLGIRRRASPGVGAVVAATIVKTCGGRAGGTGRLQRTGRRWDPGTRAPGDHQHRRCRRRHLRRDARGRAGVIARHERAPGLPWDSGARAPGDHRCRRCRRRQGSGDACAGRPPASALSLPPPSSETTGVGAVVVATGDRRHHRRDVRGAGGWDRLARLRPRTALGCGEARAGIPLASTLSSPRVKL